MSDINEMNVGPRWYVAHTYSGYENKIKTSLEKVIENKGLGDQFFDIRIPVEIVIEKKGDVEKDMKKYLVFIFIQFLVVCQFIIYIILREFYPFFQLLIRESLKIRIHGIHSSG